MSTLHHQYIELSISSPSPSPWFTLFCRPRKESSVSRLDFFFFLLFSWCNFKLKVVEWNWDRFISARRASECILWPQSKGCTLACACYSIILHVLQNTVIRQTAKKKSISCHHVSFWLTADSRRQAKVHSAL